MNESAIRESGKQVDTIKVELSARFLKIFSEQLYSSPQKAFEELISNSWDAGASVVRIQIAEDLSVGDATMAVLDNGTAMNLEGLRALWHVAFSTKVSEPQSNERPAIGKFGIGKLATYVLARKLTYVSCGNDGVIRKVTMDYGEIEQRNGPKQDKLLSELVLPVYELTRNALDAELAENGSYKEIRNCINTDFQHHVDTAQQERTDVGLSEYGELCSAPLQPDGTTWTLVILSDLKPVGQGLKIGILRRMLSSALPLGAEMRIYLNGEWLRSPKMDVPIEKKWKIGPELKFTSICVDRYSDAAAEEETAFESNDPGGTKQNNVSIMLENEPEPHVNLPGIGKVIGQVTLFADKVSGGKSDMRGASNGFHINVLGRVVNQSDPSFGEKNLSHAVWSRFRMTVRADGLDDFLTTNREQFQERRELAVFRAFLRKAFNKARSWYDEDDKATMPDGGDVLVQSLGFISLKPLRNVVSESLREGPPLPDLLDESGIEDREGHRAAWKKDTAYDIGSALGEVRFGEYPDDSFVKYKVSDRSIVVNNHHPFVQEHARSRAGKLLLRSLAMVTVLSDIQGVDVGINPRMLHAMRRYRDSLMRRSALKDRRSGESIRSLLAQSQHDTKSFKRLEAITADALRFLGFEVELLGKSGEPDGVAKAFSLPPRNDSRNRPPAQVYSFTFDAKSTGKTHVETNNIRLDAVVKHKGDHDADYALVIAPGYSGGASTERFAEQRVTPITTSDLGTLVRYTVTYGAVSLGKLREVFGLFAPREVEQWVSELGQHLKEQRKLTIDVFLQALKAAESSVTDELPPAVIGIECNKIVGDFEVKSDEVRILARGLEVIVPDLIAFRDDQIVLNTSAERLAEAITSQLEKRVQPGDGDSDG